MLYVYIKSDIGVMAVDEVDRIERRLKLRDLRVLVSVVQHGSMVKAAEHLGTSQPAVSRTISDLEHSLGLRLFDRSPQGIVPTPYGHALITPGAMAGVPPPAVPLRSYLLPAHPRFS